MNSKQLYQKYLETLFEKIQNYDLLMFHVPPHNELFLCNKSEFTQVFTEVTKYGFANPVASQIPNVDELLKVCEGQEKTNIKKSISTNIVYIRYGLNRYSPNSFTTSFNVEVILSLLEKIEKNDFKQIFDNLKNLFIRYGDISETYWNILKAVKKQYGKEKTIEIFNAIPNQMFEFSAKENLKKYIINTLNNVAKIVDKDHQLIVNFVKKRASKAVISQIGSIELRDALIDFHQGDLDLLEDYKDFVPSLQKYLSQTEDGDFFLEKTPRIISRIIDLEEFKAVTSIQISSNDEYLQLILIFLNQFKLKDKRIISFYASKSYLNRKDHYISLFVSCKPDNPLPEAEFDVKLKSFAKLLNRENPSDSATIRPLLDAWWSAEELERELKVSGEKIKKTKL